MTKQQITTYKPGIARRLIINVVLFSFLITIFDTALQLYWGYKNELNYIKDQLQQIEDVNLRSINESLWTSDIKELNTLIDGISQLRDIQFLEIRDNEKVWVSRGKYETRNIISRQYPLTHSHRGQELKIGTLTVNASLDGVYQRLFDKFWVILASNAIKTFLIASFILFIFYQLITRHLLTITNFARDLKINQLGKPLTLSRKHKKTGKIDELDMVVNAINQMQQNIKQAFDALKQSEDRVRLLMDSTAEAIYGMDRNGRCTFANPACLKFLGYDHYDELVGKELHNLINHTYPDGRPYPVELSHIYNAARSGQSIHIDNEVLWRRDGSCFPAEYWSHPIRKDNELIGAVVTFIDISERKHAEDELKKYRNHLEELVAERTSELTRINSELESFSYSVSHDLRAPLRAIDGFSQALQEDCGEQIDDTGTIYLQRICAGAQRMGELIDDLLSLSRVSRIEMSRTKVNLSLLAENSIRKLQENDPERKLEVKIEDNIQAQGDAHLLEIVFDNLLANAWKYTSKKPSAYIEFGITEKENNIVYYVKDNGAGFDMQYASKLFGAFQRLHGNEFEGTGIGLATVARIIHRHGGKVWATAEMEQGATFYFTLEK
ncbi:Sensory box histidine kinase [hydrothermal vent metagenome]|uniref:histidine kinase n=1 Tax=hydrothermal vent metagenome TaxID=652676 RepID=A0A3B1B4L1_9ZZZZ